MLGFALPLNLILTGFFGRYRNVTPLASTCSAAISAACHRLSRHIQAHYFQVQWGVVSVNPETHVGHCAFTTAKDVTWDKSRPESGHLYAWAINSFEAGVCLEPLTEGVANLTHCHISWLVSARWKQTVRSR